MSRLMDVPKYAELENERRFLVIHCPDVSTSSHRLIEDIYLTGSRLRLRSVTHADGTREFKFCKKYGSSDPVSGPVVNVYLSEREYAILSQLHGQVLRKRRYRVSWHNRTFGLDVFEGPLAGLILCEAEAESPDAIRSLEFPPWAARDVTGERFFTGGNLAYVTAAELELRLSI